MRSIRSRAVLVCLLVASGAACSAGMPGDGGEVTDHAEQAVFSRDDGGNPVASSAPFFEQVVRIPALVTPRDPTSAVDPTKPGCSGVLVTGQLVLTSSRCVSDAAIANPRVVEKRKADGSLARRGWHLRDAMPSNLTEDGVDQGDLALLELSVPTASDVYEWRGTRPADHALIPEAEFSEDGDGDRPFPKISMAGWSPFGLDGGCQLVRVPAYDQAPQQVSIDNGHLTWLRADDGATSLLAHGVKAPYGLCPDIKVGLHDGDVGGPLYVARWEPREVGAVLAWDLIGVATRTVASGNNLGGGEPLAGGAASPDHVTGTMCANPTPRERVRCDLWIDLTAPDATAFMKQNAALGVAARGSYWAERHARLDGRTLRTPALPDWWIGEGDAQYSASCDKTHDADCDGWFEKDGDGMPRDNCPGVFNPDQADSDQDGIGSQCDTVGDNAGRDLDLDTVLNADDTCPYVYDTSNKDTDGDGVGDVCDYCPKVYDSDRLQKKCVASCGTVALPKDAAKASVTTSSEADVSSKGATYGVDACEDRFVVELVPGRTSALALGFLGTSVVASQVASETTASCTSATLRGTAEVWGLDKTNHWVLVERESSAPAWSKGSATSAKGCHVDVALSYPGDGKYSRIRVAATAQRKTSAGWKDLAVHVAAGITYLIHFTP